jgi:hypothetical protein
MRNIILCGIISTMLLVVLSAKSKAQPITRNTKAFSLGMRSTVSLFNDDGTGIGTGGQFRIQANQHLNTDWFADYILINQLQKVRSEYIHIGWSVLYYPFKAPTEVFSWQPFFLAGHCFDYNQKTLLANTSINKHRWGAAPQLGVGAHFWLSERADITFMTQYMIHLTKEIELVEDQKGARFELATGRAFEGHWLNTISINYKLFAR